MQNDVLRCGMITTSKLCLQERLRVGFTQPAVAFWKALFRLTTAIAIVAQRLCLCNPRGNNFLDLLFWVSARRKMRRRVADLRRTRKVRRRDFTFRKRARRIPLRCKGAPLYAFYIKRFTYLLDFFALVLLGLNFEDFSIAPAFTSKFFTVSVG